MRLTLRMNCIRIISLSGAKRIQGQDFSYLLYISASKLRYYCAQVLQGSAVT